MSGDKATAGARTAGERRPGGAAGGAGPPKAGAAGTALAVVAVAGTALGALLLRPDRSIFAKSQGPLGAGTGVLILIAVACLGAGLALSSRYRRRLGYDQDLPSFEQRLADVVRYTLIGAGLAVPVLLMTMHRFPTGGAVTAPTPTVRTGLVPPVKTPPPPPPPNRSGGGASLDIPRILLWVGVALLVAALLVAGYRLWRQLRHGPAEEPDGATYGAADEDQALADAVDSGRRALLGGDDARAAVIACYAAMEASLAASGVARRASDSPQDLLERASGDGLLTGPHATGLTALFREARYSTHPMDDTHRDRAGAALAAIAAQLADRAADAAADDAADDAADPHADGRPQAAGAHR